MAQEVERLVAEVEVKTTKALAAIKKWKKQVRKELKELVKESVELALDGNTKQIDAKIKKLRKELEDKIRQEKIHQRELVGFFLIFVF